MSGYKVSDSRQMSTMTQTGTAKQFYRVWLQTDMGATGYVDVPPSEWKEDTLPGILQAKADELDLAFRLAG